MQWDRDHIRGHEPLYFCHERILLGNVDRGLDGLKLRVKLWDVHVLVIAATVLVGL